MPPTTPQHKGFKRARRSAADVDDEDNRPSKRVKKPEATASVLAKKPAQRSIRADSHIRKSLKSESAMAMKSSQDFENRQAQKEELQGQHVKQQGQEQTARVTTAPEKAVQTSKSRAQQHGHHESTRPLIAPVKAVHETAELPKAKTASSKPRARVQQKAASLADWLVIAERAQGIVEGQYLGRL